MTSFIGNGPVIIENAKMIPMVILNYRQSSALLLMKNLTRKEQ